MMKCVPRLRTTLASIVMFGLYLIIYGWNFNIATFTTKSPSTVYLSRNLDEVVKSITKAQLKDNQTNTNTQPTRIPLNKTNQSRFPSHIHTKHPPLPSSPPRRPFLPGSPKLILLLAYQRVGSTYMGNLFNENTARMAYTYEPLDSVYTRLYGTAVGWAVPTDIHFHWNGTHRESPDFEKEAISSLIGQIFTCDYDHMISEYVLSDFWTHFKQHNLYAAEYVKCLARLQMSTLGCRQVLEDVCPRRMGEADPSPQSHCHARLTATYSQPQHEKFTNHVNKSSEFQRYRRCMDTGRMKVFQMCVPDMKAVCESKSVRVIKTVRLELDVVEGLMDRFPNMRVIQLIRDPRPVVLSRLTRLWASAGSTDVISAKLYLKMWRRFSAVSQNRTSNNSDLIEYYREKHNSVLEKSRSDFRKEARLYCSSVVRDIRTRRRIEQKYPGATYHMLYEDMVRHPALGAKKLYEFINETIPFNIASSIKAYMTGSKKENPRKWEDKVSMELLREIEESCQMLYDELQYNWPE